MIITRENEAKVLKRLFFKSTGYGEHDLLVFNPDIRTFMTRNGGVYKISSLGKVEWIKGPSYQADERI